jgi:mannosyltransferase OCH1-like enzyme
MERLSIESFLHHGHPFHLYVYQDVEGIPPGAVVRDAAEILPESRIFRYKQHNSVAGFSDFFRFKLLLEKGGWWSDTDVVCLQPFEFSDPFVFSSELTTKFFRKKNHVTTGVLKAPAGNPILEAAWDFCQKADPQKIVWGQCGPRLLDALVKRHGAQHSVQSPEVFCPVHYPKWQKLLDPTASWSFNSPTVAIHLWNELWRRAGFDKDRQWDEQCLYEQLKRRYPSATATSN